MTVAGINKINCRRHQCDTYVHHAHDRIGNFGCPLRFVFFLAEFTTIDFVLLAETVCVDEIRVMDNVFSDSAGLLVASELLRSSLVVVKERKQSTTMPPKRPNTRERLHPHPAQYVPKTPNQPSSNIIDKTVFTALDTSCVTDWKDHCKHHDVRKQRTLGAPSLHDPGLS